VLEKELAAWLAKRTAGRPDGVDCHAAVRSILAAADATTRRQIVNNLRSRNASLAERLAPAASAKLERTAGRTSDSRKAVTWAERTARVARSSPPAPAPKPAVSPRVAAPRPARFEPLPRLHFDELVHLDNRTWAAVLGEVDATVLTLALAGSTDELIDRICDQMPKRTAQSFRRQLRRLGPIRLHDVESAQRAVAEVAARRLAEWQASAVAAIS
jgi:flagellar motor switch protein FliG